MPKLTPFELDLTVEEGRRLSAVHAALVGWDPLAVLAGAHRLPYPRLDRDQLHVLKPLVRQGTFDA